MCRFWQNSAIWQRLVRPAERSSSHFWSSTLLCRWRPCRQIDTLGVWCFAHHSYRMKCQLTAPDVGLEPTTLRLRVSCSTDWASRAYMNKWLESLMWLSCNFGANFSYYYRFSNNPSIDEKRKHGVAGVVVSCKIPILATRVRFPGDATYFMRVVTSYICVTRFELPVLWVPAWPNG